MTRYICEEMVENSLDELAADFAQQLRERERQHAAEVRNLTANCQAEHINAERFRKAANTPFRSQGELNSLRDSVPRLRRDITNLAADLLELSDTNDDLSNTINYYETENRCLLHGLNGSYDLSYVQGLRDTISRKEDVIDSQCGEINDLHREIYRATSILENA
jgi:hypothetical protein